MEVITLAPCLFHSTAAAAAAAQAGCDTMKPAARPHPHTLWRITAVGPAHCHMETLTSGSKMVFVYKVIESIWIFFSFSFHPLFIRRVFHQAWIHCVVSVGFTGISSIGIAEISCLWASILLLFWPSNTKRYNLCSTGLQLIQGNSRSRQ